MAQKSILPIVSILVKRGDFALIPHSNSHSAVFWIMAAQMLIQAQFKYNTFKPVTFSILVRHYVQEI